MATDPRGTSRWIYWFFPADALDDCEFWRYDRWMDAWQQLDWGTAVTAIVGAGGAGVPGIGCAMVVDASSQVIGANNADVWLTIPDTIAPWMQILYYDAGANTWFLTAQGGGAFTAVAQMAARLAASWAGDCRICHTSSALSADADNGLIVISGNNGPYTYRYDIGTDAVTCVGGENRAGNTGPGLTLDWDPASANYIISCRATAGGSLVVDRLDIATATWAVIANVLPGSDLWTTGTDSCVDIHNRNFLMHLSGSGRIRSGNYAGAALTITNAGQMYGTNGTPHVGNCMAWGIEGSRRYIYLRRHTSTEFQRITLVE